MTGDKVTSYEARIVMLDTQRDLISLQVHVGYEKTKQRKTKINLSREKVMLQFF